MDPTTLRPSTNHEDLERNDPDPIWLQDELEERLDRVLAKLDQVKSLE